MSYTYTPDGLPLRTTEASGVWKECVYDSSRRLVGAISSDGAQDAFFEHDAFGRIVFESNTVSQVSYSLDRLGLATNEVQTVNGVSVVLRRTSDEFGRQVSFARVGGISSSFAYTNGTHLASVLTPDASARYRFSNDWLDEGYEMTVGGRTFDRWTSHDWYRRGLVDGVWYAQGDHDDCIIYSYDLMGRPSVRNNDVFGYNARGEVVAATIGGQSETHVYNDIGTHVTSTDPFANTAYASNAWNQYASIVRTADAAQEGEPVSVAYDADGSLTTFGPWTYAYDSGRRLTSVASNGVTVATMSYDAQGRRVKKVAADGTHRYFYDGWLLVYEHITHADSTIGEIEYVWGKDISGRRNGAAGIGGLLYLKRNGAIYVPYADAYGNILGYWDANSNLVAAYTYNAFGKAIAQEGAMADAFALRYSTKYYDAETGLYYYGCRFYHPTLMRWLSRDPMDEEGGVNLYGVCCNNCVSTFDLLGLWSATFESLCEKRRVYKKEDKDKDTIKTLAQKVGLDENAFSKWARIEDGPSISPEKSGVSAPNTDAALKEGCYISVPNIWIEADLLRGGGIYDHVIVNHGGTIGSFFGQTLGRWGYYTLKPGTPKELLKMVEDADKDLYGMTVYAHGSPNGYIVSPGGSDAIHQTKLMASIRAGGYRIAKANMMQCYSLNPKGTIPTDAGTEESFNYKSAWGKRAVKVFGYEGVNVIGIDF